MTDGLDIVWERQDQEPEEWYERFVKFYLPLGPTRTLLKAYMNEKLATDDQKALEVATLTPRTAPNNWSTVSNEWSWRQRAYAYDIYAASASSDKIAQARSDLQNLAQKAVKALDEALDNPRSKVAAAKEVLDRVGIPAVSGHIVANVPFTSDDFASAQQQVAAWKRKMSESNG